MSVPNFCPQHEAEQVRRDYLQKDLNAAHAKIRDLEDTVKKLVDVVNSLKADMAKFAVIASAAVFVAGVLVTNFLRKLP